MFHWGKMTPEVPEAQPELAAPLPSAPAAPPSPDPNNQQPTDSKHKDKPKDKGKAPKKKIPKDKTKPAKPAKPRASSASSARVPSHSAVAAGKQPDRAQSQDLNQSLHDFRFPPDPITLNTAAANLDTALANPHIELPPVDDNVSAIHHGDFGKKTPAPSSKCKKPEALRRKKLKLLPRRAVKKARGYALRLKNRLKRRRDKVKCKRPMSEKDSSL
jgi:hypothetical protein